MKKIFFLVGLNKTGTTFLRKLIKLNPKIQITYLGISKDIWKFIKEKNSKKKRQYVNKIKRKINLSKNKIVLVNCEDQLIPYKKIIFSIIC